MKFNCYLVSLLAPKNYFCYKELLNGSSVITAWSVLRLRVKTACVRRVGNPDVAYTIRHLHIKTCVPLQLLLLEQHSGQLNCMPLLSVGTTSPVITSIASAR